MSGACHPHSPALLPRPRGRGDACAPYLCLSIDPSHVHSRSLSPGPCGHACLARGPCRETDHDACPYHFYACVATLILTLGHHWRKRHRHTCFLQQAIESDGGGDAPCCGPGASVTSGTCLYRGDCCDTSNQLMHYVFCRPGFLYHHGGGCRSLLHGRRIVMTDVCGPSGGRNHRQPAVLLNVLGLPASIHGPLSAIAPGDQLCLHLFPETWIANVTLTCPWCEGSHHVVESDYVLFSFIFRHIVHGTYDLGLRGGLRPLVLCAGVTLFGGGW